MGTISVFQANILNFIGCPAFFGAFHLGSDDSLSSVGQEIVGIIDFRGTDDSNYRSTSLLPLPVQGHQNFPHGDLSIASCSKVPGANAGVRIALAIFNSLW